MLKQETQGELGRIASIYVERSSKLNFRKS